MTLHDGIPILFGLIVTVSLALFFFVFGGFEGRRDK